MLTLGNFGSQYKKSSSFKTEQHTQCLMYGGEGKEETDALFKELQKQITAVSPNSPECLQTVLQSHWLYGVSNDYCATSSTPNGMAMFKLLAQGQMKWLFFEIESLVAQLKIEKQADTFAKDEVMTEVEKADTARVKTWLEAGVKIKAAVQEQSELIYCPAGWLTSQKVVSGVLVYGVRHSILLKSESHAKNFEAWMGLQGDDLPESALEKLNEALDCMKA